MIQEFIKRFDKKRTEILQAFSEKHPKDYAEIVKALVMAIGCNDGAMISADVELDPERIHKIDDGDYQGTLLFVIGATGYQPRKYWATRVWYGSCSGCDTLEGIRNYSSDKPTEEQAKQYFTLALHILQELKEI